MSDMNQSTNQDVVTQYVQKILNALDAEFVYLELLGNQREWFWILRLRKDNIEIAAKFNPYHVSRDISIDALVKSCLISYNFQKDFPDD